MSTEILQLVLTKVTEISERTVRVEEKLARTEEKVDQLNNEVQKIEEQDQIQNELIAEHIKGVKTNKQRLDIEIDIRNQLHKEYEDRIAKLEAYPKFFGIFKNIMLYLATLAGALTTIWNLFKG